MEGNQLNVKHEINKDTLDDVTYDLKIDDFESLLMMQGRTFGEGKTCEGLTMVNQKEA